MYLDIVTGGTRIYPIKLKAYEIDLIHTVSGIKINIFYICFKINID